MIASILSFLTGGLVDKIVGLGEAYLDKEVSEAQFRAEVERALADTAARITESHQETIRQSQAIQRAVVFVTVSQCLVLLLYQIGGPLWPMITGDVFPAPVLTVEWAYGLVAAGIGANWLVKRWGA